MFDTTLTGKQLVVKYQTQTAYLEDDVGFRVAIGTLVSLSLIQTHLSEATLHVHPLVHEWVRVRLNPYPEQQAMFTNVAALILYQYLPSEILSLDYYPAFIPEKVSHRIRQVSHHIGVLANLGDYSMHATTIPLEYFVLCEHSFYPFDISDALSKDLGHIIKLIISRLPLNQRSSYGSKETKSRGTT